MCSFDVLIFQAVPRNMNPLVKFILTTIQNINVCYPYIPRCLRISFAHPFRIEYVFLLPIQTNLQFVRWNQNVPAVCCCVAFFLVFLLLLLLVNDNVWYYFSLVLPQPLELRSWVHTAVLVLWIRYVYVHV